MHVRPLLALRILSPSIRRVAISIATVSVLEWCVATDRGDKRENGQLWARACVFGFIYILEGFKTINRLYLL